MPKHAIITWDRSFRNFFHLLPSLAEQDYPMEEVEVIVVEQMSRSHALQYAGKEECAPAEEVIAGLEGKLTCRIVYLDEDDGVYHPGRLLNHGIRLTTGTIVSTMDADILVPPDFLTLLDQLHARGPRVVNMQRSQAPFACGTTNADWKNQIIDFELVRNLCSDGWAPIPREVANKAPLISAPRTLWEQIQGYDEHPIFSTAYTLFGRDISLRFKLLIGEDCEIPHPRRCIHPWHPTEVDRKGDAAKVLFEAQTIMLRWSEQHSKHDREERTVFMDRFYQQNRAVIDDAIAMAEGRQKSLLAGARPLNAEGGVG